MSSKIFRSRFLSGETKVRQTAAILKYICIIACNWRWGQTFSVVKNLYISTDEDGLSWVTQCINCFFSCSFSCRIQTKKNSDCCWNKEWSYIEDIVGNSAFPIFTLHSTHQMCFLIVCSVKDKWIILNWSLNFRLFV